MYLDPMHTRILQCLEANGPQRSLDLFETFKRPKPYKTDDADVVAAWCGGLFSNGFIESDNRTGALVYFLTEKGQKLFKPVTIPPKVDPLHQPCKIAKHPGIKSTRSFAQTQRRDPEDFDLIEDF